MSPSLPLTRTIPRRLVIWTVGGLVTLVGVALGVVGLIFWPAVDLRDAEKLLARDNPAAARGVVDRYLARWPKDPRALLLAARAARRSDACADAERFLAAFEQASRPTDLSQLEWVLLGVQQGDFADQEDVILSAVSRNRSDAPAMLEAMAKGYYVAYRMPEALGLLSSLIEESPDHVPALVLRGTILDRLRHSDEALEDLRQVVDQAPESAPARAALAGVLSRLGYVREAVYHYELALRIRPKHPETLLGLSRALTDAAEPAEAQRPLDELLAADPDHADGLVERGRLALRRGQPGEAEPFLARAVRAAPWHRDAHRLFLVALRELGRTQEASQCEARLAELREEDAIAGRLKLRARDSPDDVAILWDLWLWCRRNGQDDEGLSWLAQLLRFAPGHVQAQTALAEYFDRRGQPRRAALHRSAASGLSFDNRMTR